MTADSNDALWAKLAEPFPADWIEKLPKQLRRDDQQRGRCQPAGDRQSPVSADGHHCGGWHARAVHLDYVGHAGITMRLNDVVGPDNWTLEPYAETEEGLPLLARGEFWVKLTILGVSKMEVAANFFSTQEAVGDALRRAAMRFGMGTYLWSKSDQALALATHNDAPPEPTAEEKRRDELLDSLRAAADAAGIPLGDLAGEWASDHDGQHIAEATDLDALAALRDDVLARKDQQ